MAGENQYIRYAEYTHEPLLRTKYFKGRLSVVKERTRSVIRKSDKSFFRLLLVGWYRDYIVPSF